MTEPNDTTNSSTSFDTPSTSSNKIVLDTAQQHNKKANKKARTAYFVFAEERRPEVQSKYPGEGVAAYAKILGQLWSNLSTEEKQTYHEKAAAERKELLLKQPSVENDPSSSSLLVLPLAKIKKIIKLDPEIKNISKEAVECIAKCAELFTIKLGKDTLSMAQIQNRRTILPQDVVEVCSTKDCYMFVREDLRDLAKEQKQLKQNPQANIRKTKNTATNSTASTKPITSFFVRAES
jgi:DNA-directed RNA polymerase I subunit RPA43